jgi:hypothetical protein
MQPLTGTGSSRLALYGVALTLMKWTETQSGNISYLLLLFEILNWL